LDRRQRAQSAVRAAEACLGTIEVVEVDGDPEILGATTDLLRRWLRTPMPLAKAAPVAPSWAGPAAALAGAFLVLMLAMLAALVLGLWGAPIFALLMSVPLIGLVIWGLVTRKTRTPTVYNQREVLERAWNPDGPEPPSAWTDEAVVARLDELEKAYEANRLARELHRRRKEAKRDLQVAQEELEDAKERVARTLVETGLTAGYADALLLQQAELLKNLAEAQIELEELETAVSKATEAVEDALCRFGQWLQLLQPEKKGIADVAEAKVRMRAVSKQVNELGIASRRRDDQQTLVETTRKRVKAAQDELDGLYREVDLEPGDDESLRTRMGHLANYTDLRKRVEDSTRRIAEIEENLVGRPDLLEMDEAGASTQIESLEALAGELSDRAKAVSDLESDIRVATEGQTLEQLRANVETSESALAEVRDRSVENAMGIDLMDWLAGAISRDHTPAVLDKAHRWFLRFTHGRYELQVKPEIGFVAIDTFDQVERRLSELSDGTRIQLLLAARLAFLEEAEGDGPRLPIFLDEVLSTTDRARFREVGCCLLELIANGRQVLYATADQAEVAYWKVLCEERGMAAPRVVDLGEVGSGSPWPKGKIAAPANPEPVPDPAGHDATSYARVLGVSVPDSQVPASAWPLVLLLHDYLDEVAACQRAGISKVGQLLSLRDAGGIPLPLSDDVAALVETRVDLLVTVLQLRKVGRGKPLSWEVIVASGTVTPSFEERMRNLLGACRLDAAGYVAGAQEFKRFGRPRVQKLRDYLVESGHLDERAVLGVDDICEQVTARMSGHMAEARLSLGAIRPFVEWVVELVG
jgi:hypothetical protein